MFQIIASYFVNLLTLLLQRRLYSSGYNDSGQTYCILFHLFIQCKINNDIFIWTTQHPSTFLLHLINALNLDLLHWLTIKNANQVKLWNPLRKRAIPERLRGVFTTRRYTNLRLPYLVLPLCWPACLINLLALPATPRLWNFIICWSVWVRFVYWLGFAWQWQHCTVRKYHSD